MKHLIVAIASAVALVVSGFGSVALGSPAVTPGGKAPGVGVPGPTVTPPDPGTSLPGEAGSILQAILDPLGLGPGPGSPSSRSPSGPAPPDGGLVPDRVARKGPIDPFAALAAGAYAGYATGTAYASDADLSGAGIYIEKAFSGATYGSAALAARIDELERSVAPALGAAQGFGRGSAAEIGRGEERDEIEEEIDDNADAQAPPTRDAVSKELADVDLTPLLHADLLRSRASARSATNGCVVGSDLALGQGSAIRSDVPGEKKDADRPILSLSEDEPPRAVTQSLSHTGLVPPATMRTARFGLFSETRQTIAPVTLFKGTDQQLTIELGGEWILRVVADGTRGTISYGPVVDDPDTPVLRIHRKNGDDVVFTAQDVMDEEGTDLGVPGVEEFIIGEDPRGIGGRADSKPISTASRVAAAVDVLRVRIPDDDEPDGVTELRVGHMEVAVAVPAGGISCPGIAMAKRSDPSTVRPGQRFAWTITVANPNDCMLDKVKVVDTVTATSGVRYRIVSTSPKSTISASTLTFEGLGPLRMGQSRTVRIEVDVEEGSAPGGFTDEAVATGLCGPVRVGGESEASTGVGAAAAVPREGRVVLEAPEVAAAGVPALASAPERPAPGAVAGESVARSPAKAAAQAGTLARTGGGDRFLPGLALLATASLLRRLRRGR